MNPSKVSIPAIAAIPSKPCARPQRPGWARAALALSAGLLAFNPAAQADTKVRVSSFTYNAQGLLEKETIEPLGQNVLATANDCLETTYTYDGYGNKIKASTTACVGATGSAISSFPLGSPREASSSFDAYSVTIAGVTYTTPAGLAPTKSSNALSTVALEQSEKKTYDARFGVMTSLTGPNGLSTTWAYDGFGRKTLETRADGTTTEWDYKLCSDTTAPLPACPTTIGQSTVKWVVIEQSYKFATPKTVNAPEKRQYYDTLNRVVRSQTQGFDGSGTALSLVQDTKYNALGQVTDQSNQYALNGTPEWTSFTYDALGRTVSQTLLVASANAGGNATTTFAYNGLTTTVTNAKGQTKTTVKNAQGQVASVIDALGSTITYT